MTQERPIRRMEVYRLIHSNSPDAFEEEVNILLGEGYEFINRHMQDGNPNIDMGYYTEMASFVDIRETVNEPMRFPGDPVNRDMFEEVTRAPTAQERMAMAGQVMPAPPPNIPERLRRAAMNTIRGTDEVREVEPEFDEDIIQETRPTQDGRFLWTVETGDGIFEDEVDEDEMSDHQLNRLGVANNLADNDNGDEEAHEVPAPNALLEAVEMMRQAETRQDARAIGNVPTMDGGMRQAMMEDGLDGT